MAHLDPSSIRKIGVFRALVLGDLVCAVPALRALRAGFPSAQITLIGLPWARDWVTRQPELDGFIEFPGHPELPERSVDAAAAAAFPERMRQEQFDLLVQLHGSGSIVNEMMTHWGARHIAAFHEPGGLCPEQELSCPWPVQGTELERLLQLPLAIGAPLQGTNLSFPLTAEDEQQAQSLLASAGVAGTVDRLACLHAGAQLPSRRWPAERFAHIADALCAAGWTVVLTGTPNEAELGRTVEGAMRHRPVNVIGRTSLWPFGALIKRARLVVCNDTGASHVAAALGTPSVVISSGSDVSRWAPADSQRHHVLWSPRACRPCAHAVCPYEQACAKDIGVGQVWDAIRQVAPIEGLCLQESMA